MTQPLDETQPLDDVSDSRPIHEHVFDPLPTHNDAVDSQPLTDDLWEELFGPADVAEDATKDELVSPARREYERKVLRDKWVTDNAAAMMFARVQKREADDFAKNQRREQEELCKRLKRERDAMPRSAGALLTDTVEFLNALNK